MILAQSRPLIPQAYGPESSRLRLHRFAHAFLIAELAATEIVLTLQSAICPLFAFQHLAAGLADALIVLRTQVLCPQVQPAVPAPIPRPAHPVRLGRGR